MPWLAAVLALAVTPLDAWTGAHQRRALVEVQAPADAGVPAGYAVRVVFDHAAEVAAGRSRPDGEDVALCDWVDGGFVARDRVVDTGSAWGTPTKTVLWARLPRALGAAQQDTGLYLFWGGPPASPLQEPRAVFTFFDGFEAAALGPEWVPGVLYPGGRMVPTAARAHLGSRALVSRPDGTSGSQRVLNVQVPADAELDAWVSSDPVNVDIVYLYRFTEPDRTLMAVMGVAGQLWELAHRDNGNYFAGTFGVNDPVGAAWRRVTLRYAGDHSSVLLDGASVFGTPWVMNPAGFASGTVGLGRGDPASALDGGRDFWVDDFRVRPFQWAEPSVALTQVVLANGQTCARDADCASGRCVLQTCQSRTDAGAPADAGTDAGAGADGGTGLRPEALEVRCGCSAAGAPLALVALLWGKVAWRCRRRARPEGQRPQAVTRSCGTKGFSAETVVMCHHR